MTPESSDDVEPPTEPLDSLFTEKKTLDVAQPAAGPAFAHARYRFTSGVPAGETAHIRDDSGATVFTYRGFASIVGIVAALMSGIVIVAGGAAVVLLMYQKRPLPALAALILSVSFAILIAMLVPRTSVTLYNGAVPSIAIAQASRFTFPSVTYAVTTPDGQTLGQLRRNFLSRLGRNRWTIFNNGHYAGVAIEESFSRALVRKFAGKFHRKYDANVIVDAHGMDTATIVRRDNGHGEVDVLEVRGDTIDRRVLVALATLVLGAEP